MQNWIIAVMNQFGYAGIALLIAIENIFPPIPSEIILAFGGFMTTQSNMNIALVSLSATIGSVTGAIALYCVGRLVTPKRLGRLVDKWGFLLRVKRQHIQKAEEWFHRRGCLTVFFCRFIPIVRSLISIPAGMTHMALGKFLLYTALGTAIWNTVLVYLGALAGVNWKTIVSYITAYSYIICIAVFIAGICFTVWFVKKRNSQKK